MIEIVELLKGSILDDIEDVRKANHEKLLDRNDIKLEYMEQIASLKEELNQNLIQEVQAGVNVDKYREDVDRLEVHLIQLSKLNTKLAAIVLPVKEMYREIIEDISKANGGSLFEVRA
ncbi:MAG: hypothetical protein KAQ94_08530 [Arcobacteraceae bacterium]|nr:hypothetical protein [Arcobacteraceae bacterium]